MKKTIFILKNGRRRSWWNCMTCGGNRLRPKKPDRIIRRVLRSKVWSAWSKYLRSRAADESGRAACYTCLESHPWQELQAGHFIHGKLDFDEMNIHPQCVRCNNYLSGNLGAYALRLVDEYGREAVEALRARASQHGGYSIAELEEVLARVA